jgi:hypothetical protein
MTSPSSPVTPAAPTDPTSLAIGDYTSTIILNRIFSLLVKMTTSLQNVAAAQAARLNFMSQWQSAYTDVMSQVHTFVKGDGLAFSSTSSSDATTRDDMNRLNSNFIQTLQNRQSVVSDDAKALQSNISQSNDAVNQQLNLGVAILQELSGLLPAIFR